MQETFWRVWNRIQTFDSDKEKLDQWIATIARNRAVDHLRSTRNTPQFSFDMLESNASFFSTESHALRVERENTVLKGLKTCEELADVYELDALMKDQPRGGEQRARVSRRPSAILLRALACTDSGGLRSGNASVLVARYAVVGRLRIGCAPAPNGYLSGASKSCSRFSVHFRHAPGVLTQQELVSANKGNDAFRGLWI
jgi:hypothetical protein